MKPLHLLLAALACTACTAPDSVRTEDSVELPPGETAEPETDDRSPGLDWPGWRGSARDGVWREDKVSLELADEIELEWSVPIGSGYSGPTVANQRVYLMDRLDEPEEVERVHCLDWETGESIWTHTYSAPYVEVSYKAGPRASVLIEDGLAYSLGTMGHLYCFDAETGDVLWSHDIGAEVGIDMPIWGVAGSPILEGDLLIVPACGKDACVIAYDARRGTEVWRALSDRGNYSSPIVIDQAGERVLVHLTGDRLVGLDPATGDLHWSLDFKPRNMPLSPPTPIFDGEHLFVTGFYDGCMLVRVSQDELAVEQVWRRRGRNELRTDGLHSIISTPYIDGDYIYGVDSYGELRCLELATGDRVWEDQTAVPRARWATIHFVRHGDKTWLFNERGELIVAELTPEGYTELDRGKLIAPTMKQLQERGGVCWTHPAFAYRHVFIRNDEELVCADLSVQE